MALMGAQPKRSKLAAPPRPRATLANTTVTQNLFHPNEYTAGIGGAAGGNEEGGANSSGSTKVGGGSNDRGANESGSTDGSPVKEYEEPKPRKWAPVKFHALNAQVSQTWVDFLELVVAAARPLLIELQKARILKEHMTIFNIECDQVQRLVQQEISRVRQFDAAVPMTERKHRRACLRNLLALHGTLCTLREFYDHGALCSHFYLEELLQQWKFTRIVMGSTGAAVSRTVITTLQANLKIIKDAAVNKGVADHPKVTRLVEFLYERHKKAHEDANKPEAAAQKKRRRMGIAKTFGVVLAHNKPMAALVHAAIRSDPKLHEVGFRSAKADAEADLTADRLDVLMSRYECIVAIERDVKAQKVFPWNKISYVVMYDREMDDPPEYLQLQMRKGQVTAYVLKTESLQSMGSRLSSTSVSASHESRRFPVPVRVFASDDLETRVSGSGGEAIVTMLEEANVDLVRRELPTVDFIIDEKTCIVLRSVDSMSQSGAASDFVGQWVNQLAVASLQFDRCMMIVHSDKLETSCQKLQSMVYRNSQLRLIAPISNRFPMKVTIQMAFGRDSLCELVCDAIRTCARASKMSFESWAESTELADIQSLDEQILIGFPSVNHACAQRMLRKAGGSIKTLFSWDSARRKQEFDFLSSKSLNLFEELLNANYGQEFSVTAAAARSAPTSNAQQQSAAPPAQATPVKQPSAATQQAVDPSLVTPLPRRATYQQSAHNPAQSNASHQNSTHQHNHQAVHLQQPPHVQPLEAGFVTPVSRRQTVQSMHAAQLSAELQVYDEQQHEKDEAAADAQNFLHDFFMTQEPGRSQPSTSQDDEYALDGDNATPFSSQGGRDVDGGDDDDGGGNFEGDEEMVGYEDDEYDDTMQEPQAAEFSGNDTLHSREGYEQYDQEERNPQPRARMRQEDNFESRAVPSSSSKARASSIVASLDKFQFTRQRGRGAMPTRPSMNEPSHNATVPMDSHVSRGGQAGSKFGSSSGSTRGRGSWRRSAPHGRGASTSQVHSLQSGASSSGSSNATSFPPKRRSGSQYQPGKRIFRKESTHRAAKISKVSSREHSQNIAQRQKYLVQHPHGQRQANTAANTSQGPINSGRGRRSTSSGHDFQSQRQQHQSARSTGPLGGRLASSMKEALVRFEKTGDPGGQTKLRFFQQR